MLSIAFLGIGLMGKPMVENLLAAGFPMHLWNRTVAKAQAFQDQARVYATPDAAVAGADVVITMLENGNVVDRILRQHGILDAMQPGSVFIDMSSISPSLARRHARLLSANQVDYLDAPVSGGTVGAAAASLSIMVGGSAEVLRKVSAVFNALGATTYIGPVGSGQLAKLANQAIVGITIEAVSEALLLAAQGGADPAAVRQALLGGFAASRVLDLHGQRMLERNFEPGATVRVQHKDLTMIAQEAKATGLALPLVKKTLEQYQEMMVQGLENVDHSGLLLLLEQQNHCKLIREKS